MWARVAKFGGDPASIDKRVGRLRSMLETEGMPPELANAKLLLLVNRETGDALGVTLFDSEEAMRAADVVMNAGQGMREAAPASSSTKCRSRTSSHGAGAVRTRSLTQPTG